VPIKRRLAKYPKSQESHPREGWVTMSYVVDFDGSVSNVIIEQSSGYHGFDKSAVRAVKTWKYQPAMENGKSIQQCQNTVRIDFKMLNSSDAVNRNFHRLYEQVETNLAKNDLDAVKVQIEQLKGRKKNRFSEMAHLSLLQFAYEKKRGDDVAQLFHLNNAIYSGLSVFNDERMWRVLEQKFQLEVLLNRLSDAINTHKQMMAMAQSKLAMDKMLSYKKNR
jgi:TonB family protein